MKTRQILITIWVTVNITLLVYVVCGADPVKCYDTVTVESPGTPPGTDVCKATDPCANATACSYMTFSGTCKTCTTSKTETHQKLDNSSNSGVVATTHSAPCTQDAWGCGDCNWASAYPDSPSSTYCKDCVFTTTGCL